MSFSRLARRLLSAASAVALLAAAPAVAKPGDFRSGQHEGFARIVFEFAKPTAVEANASATQLTLRFAEPWTGDPAALRRAGEGLANGRLSDDRRSVIFDLRRPVTLRSFNSEASSVIDLIDAPAGAKPAAAPAPTPVVAATPAFEPGDPNLSVRIGQHPSYTRFVFDWPRETGYRVTTEAAGVRITFDQRAAVDVARLRPMLPKSIPNALAQRTPEGGLSLLLSTVPDAPTRHFKNGQSIVLDVLIPPNRDPGPLQSLNAAPPPAAMRAAAAVAPAAVAPAAVTPAPTAAAPAPTAPSQATQMAATANPIAVPPSPPQPTSLNAAPGVGLAGGQVPLRNETPPPPPAAVNIPVVFAQTPGGPRLRFALPATTPVAVFVRGEYAYVVFDRPIGFDLAAFGRGPARAIQPEPVVTPDGSALRFKIAAGANPRAARDGEGWMVTITTEPRKPATAAPLVVDGSPATGRVSVTLRDVGSVVTIPDPELGDMMRVIPTAAPGVGVDGGRQFAQFTLLPTSQGVAAVGVADGIGVTTSGNGVEIGRTGGLLLSREALRPGAGVASVFDFKRWREPDVDFVETRQSLVTKSTEADPSRRAMARFELAQFLMARDHAADAIGVLDLIANDDRLLANDPALRALRGAARVMLEDGQAAAADFADPVLMRDPALAVWRGAAAGLRDQWAEADQEFSKGGAIPTSYSPGMQEALGLLKAEAAGRAGDLTRVRQAIDPLIRAETPFTVRARAEFIRADALARRGDKRAALPIYDRLAESDDLWARAHAEYARVILRSAMRPEEGGIAPAVAIDRLEQLRFVWSGDKLQYDLLRSLGELQIENGDIRNGLSRLREAVAFFPTNPGNPAVQAKMTDVFADLYDPRSSRQLPAVTALSLFDQNRDLIPAGPRGDQLIQNLSDRLVELDLLDRAGELLQHQIRNRLKGEDKARVGAKLAFLRLLDKRPADALRALGESAEPELSRILQSDREHLRARALMEMDKEADALQVLVGDDSPDAEQLRSEIYARKQDWPMAAAALSKLAGDPNQTPLPEERQRTVLNLAVAYALANDSAGLKRVAQSFGPAMEAGGNADAFKLVTSAPTNAGGRPRAPIDQADLTRRFQEAQQFQSFMTNYSKKLRESNQPAAAVN